jgi:hypothetical protein
MIFAKYTTYTIFFYFVWTSACPAVLRAVCSEGAETILWSERRQLKAVCRPSRPPPAPLPPPELVTALRAPKYHLNRGRWQSGREGNHRNQIKAGIIDICSGFKTRDSLLIHDWEPPQPKFLHACLPTDAFFESFSARTNRTIRNPCTSAPNATQHTCISIQMRAFEVRPQHYEQILPFNHAMLMWSGLRSSGLASVREERVRRHTSV